MTIQWLCEPPPVFSPCEFRIKWASSAWEITQAQRLRRDVFCAEQGVFVGHDRDAVDSYARCLVAVACIGGEADQVVGTVRIHPGRVSEAGHEIGPPANANAQPDINPAAPTGADGLWWGSRLAVHAAFRHHARLGSALIPLAVSSAHARGCTLFLAHVQAQNGPLFECLHWRALRSITLHGRPHLLMQADLAHYPPQHDPITGFVVRSVRP